MRPSTYVAVAVAALAGGVAGFLLVPRPEPRWVPPAPRDPPKPPVTRQDHYERGSHTIEGRVIDRTGKGLEGALVEVWIGLVEDRELFGRYHAAPYVRTDATGSFHVEGLASGEHTLQVEHRGHIKRYLRLATLPAAPVTVSLPIAGRIRGTVVDENGVPRPDVFFEAVNPGTLVRRSRTEADGSFDLTWLPPGVYGFRFDIEGPTYDDVSVGEDETAEVSVKWRRPKR